jgi:hypothetical protein
MKRFFSHCAPYQFLRDFDEVCGGYLVLSHYCLQYPEYKEFFKQSTKPIILDNGSYELGVPIEADKMIMLAEEIGAETLVCPDVFMDGRGTIEATGNFLNNAKLKGSPFRLMIVPQGRNPNEYMGCLEELLNLTCEIPNLIIGVSFLVVANAFADVLDINPKRVELARPIVVGLVQTSAIRVRKQPTPIHLLGLGNPIELWAYRGNPYVESADSSYAIKLALKGMYVGLLGGLRFDYHMPNYMEVRMSDDQIQLAKTNAKTLNMMFGIGEEA